MGRYERNNIFVKFLNLARTNGLAVASKQAVFWLGISETGAIHKRRIRISGELDEVFNSTVRYGPFKGLKLSSNTWWGGTDRGSMLFGIYEKEVLDSLQNIPLKFNTFIDLGAADAC